jgi:protocatechuate 3,4-dioxygenase, alpha subunit
MDLTPTPSQTAGPFLHVGLTDTKSISGMAGKDAKGERVSLRIRLLDGVGLPVPDAMIELWQADSEGNYNGEVTAEKDFFGFGRLSTAEDGSCALETIRPGCVPGPGDTLQAPHINVSIFARGLLKRLATRVYFDCDPANDVDPVLALVPEERRATLFAHPDPARDAGWIQEIRMRGEGETVFFDV